MYTILYAPRDDTFPFLAPPLNLDGRFPTAHHAAAWFISSLGSPWGRNENPWCVARDDGKEFVPLPKFAHLS